MVCPCKQLVADEQYRVYLQIKNVIPAIPGMTFFQQYSMYEGTPQQSDKLELVYLFTNLTAVP